MSKTDDTTIQRVVERIVEAEGILREKGVLVEITEISTAVGKTRPSETRDFAHNRGDYGMKVRVAVDPTKQDSSEVLDAVNDMISLQCLAALEKKLMERMK